MLLSRRGVRPVGRRAGIRLAVPIAVALSVAGCASDRDHRRDAYAHQAHAAQQAMTQRPPAESELEDDGLPSQAPPPANRRPEPDDPREPYSPNYGRTVPLPAPVRADTMPVAKEAMARYATARGS